VGLLLGWWLGAGKRVGAGWGDCRGIVVWGMWTVCCSGVRSWGGASVYRWSVGRSWMVALVRSCWVIHLKPWARLRNCAVLRRT